MTRLLATLRAVLRVVWAARRARETARLGRLRREAQRETWRHSRDVAIVWFWPPAEEREQ